MLRPLHRTAAQRQHFGSRPSTKGEVFSACAEAGTPWNQLPPGSADHRAGCGYAGGDVLLHRRRPPARRLDWRRKIRRVECSAGGAIITTGQHGSWWTGPLRLPMKHRELTAAIRNGRELRYLPKGATSSWGELAAGALHAPQTQGREGGHTHTHPAARWPQHGQGWERRLACQAGQAWSTPGGPSRKDETRSSSRDAEER